MGHSFVRPEMLWSGKAATNTNHYEDTVVVVYDTKDRQTPLNLRPLSVCAYVHSPHTHRQMIVDVQFSGTSLKVDEMGSCPCFNRTHTFYCSVKLLAHQSV